MPDINVFFWFQKSQEVKTLAAKATKAEDRAKRAEEREHELKAQVVTLQSRQAEVRSLFMIFIIIAFFFCFGPFRIEKEFLVLNEKVWRSWHTIMN